MPANPQSEIRNPQLKDEVGNRMTQTATAGAPPQKTLAYGESTNRITTAGYTYDPSGNGNLTAMPGVSSIVYDVFDRVTSTTSGSGTSTAKYDAFSTPPRKLRVAGTPAFGRRIAPVYDATPNRTTTYFYGVNGH